MRGIGDGDCGIKAGVSAWDRWVWGIKLVLRGSCPAGDAHRGRPKPRMCLISRSLVEIARPLPSLDAPGWPRKNARPTGFRLHVDLGHYSELSASKIMP